MPTVWIPALMQDLTGGREQISVEGGTLRALVDQLERQYPGIRERLCDGNQLKPSIAVSVDGEIATTGLSTQLRHDSEVHFLPAIGGGSQVR